MIFIHGHKNALIGRATVWDTSGTTEHRAVYSGNTIVEDLVKRDGMTYEDALEYIEYNIEGAYVGPQTPIIVWLEELVE